MYATSLRPFPEGFRARKGPGNPAFGNSHDLILIAVDDMSRIATPHLADGDTHSGDHPGEMPEPLDSVAAFRSQPAHRMPSIASAPPVGHTAGDVQVVIGAHRHAVLPPQPSRLIVPIYQRSGAPDAVFGIAMRVGVPAYKPEIHDVPARVANSRTLLENCLKSPSSGQSNSPLGGGQAVKGGLKASKYFAKKNIVELRLWQRQLPGSLSRMQTADAV